VLWQRLVRWQERPLTCEKLNKIVRSSLGGHGLTLYKSKTLAEVVLGLQNWGCNAPTPFGLLGCPYPLGLPINVRNFQTWKSSSRIISYIASKFLILKRFDRHNKVILSVVTIFCCVMPNSGYKAKNWGCPLLQRKTATERWLVTWKSELQLLYLRYFMILLSLCCSSFNMFAFGDLT